MHVMRDRVTRDDLRCVQRPGRLCTISGMQYECNSDHLITLSQHIIHILYPDQFYVHS
jgi:hypothetical protein